MRPGRVASLLALAGVALAATAVLLFPKAFPAIGLDNRLTQGIALAKADSFFTAHALTGEARLGDSITRRVASFEADNEILTYVDLAAGGSDSVNALVRGTDVAPFTWSVRAFEPGQVHEARVEFAPDGRVIGFTNKLADSTRRPDVGADSAAALAKTVLGRWLGEDVARWKVATTSYKTRKPSERVDHTVTFERTDRKVGEAPVRLDVTVAGDMPSRAHVHLEIPETWSRRYSEMRSSNDLYALFANVGIVALVLLAAWTIRRFSYHKLLRWRAPIAIGGVIGALLAGAGLNAAGGAWFAYDTAMPAGIFTALTYGAALAGGVAMGVIVALTLVAAEAAARRAFPDRIDWWHLWEARGTREVASQVGAGYVVAAFGFAYVALFYLTTRHALGWWVPSELLDDPNQIATPAPWLTGIAFSLQAGVWEETLFRALPLSLLALWVGNRPNRNRWLAGGVVVTALVFGFAHANYPSWPAYSRGAELFLEASIWAVIFLRVGLVVTVVAHFCYDLVLFSIFTSTGSAVEYRVSAAIAVLALLTPAIAVIAKVVRQRGFVPLPDSARFSAWSPAATVVTPAPVTVQSVATPLSANARQLIVTLVAAAAAFAVLAPTRPVRGARFTAGRAQVVARADSMMAARGIKADDWTRLSATAFDTMPQFIRFLHEHQLDSLASPLTRTYAIPGWWTVRYVHTSGTLAERTAEWRVRIFPDGTPLDVRHIVPDSTPGDSLKPDSVRRIGRRALAAAGFDTSRFSETDYDETARPHRLDARVTWTDTTVHLPAGASARAWVSVAGSEPLVARRSIQLPESFERAERSRNTRVAAYGGLLFVILFGAMITGAIYVSRKRSQLVSDAMWTRRDLPLLVVFAAGIVASSLNGWPSTQFGYDSSTSWSNHIATSVIFAVIGVVVQGALIFGLWRLLEGLRRRAGIVAWPDPSERTNVRDALLAGLGIAAAISLGSALPAAFAHNAIAPSPTTSLAEALPIIGPLVEVPVGLFTVATIAPLPIVLLIALTPSVRTRWLIFVAVVALSIGMLAPIADSVRESELNATEAMVSLATSVGLIAAIVKWGGRSAFTWYVAALTQMGFGAARQALHSATGVERAGHALELVAAVAVMVWLAQRARNGALAHAPHPPVPAPPPAPEDAGPATA